MRRTSGIQGLPALLLVLLLGTLPLHFAVAVPVDGGDDADVYATQVQQMYLAYYGRPGDPAGVSFWADRLAEAGGNWILDLVNAFGASAEYTERFGSLSQDVLITNLYEQLFNRGPDPVGLAFYRDLLNGSNETGFNPDGRVSTLAQIALDIANGASGTDREIIDNKLRVSASFTDAIADTDTPYTADDIDAVVALIAVVGETEDSVTAAEAEVATFVKLSGFRTARVQLRAEEIVLISGGIGPPGVAFSLSGDTSSTIIHADLSPDGQTVWVITLDGDDPVDGGWGFYIMDRSALSVIRKPLPDMGSYSNRPEVAIADKFGAFGFISQPFWDDADRHWRFYSTTWDNDTGLFQKLDTLAVADIDDTFPRTAFVNFAPVDLRAVEGVEGFYFLNGKGVYAWNESSPARPIRVGFTQDLRWNGDPPPGGTNYWYGLDIGGGRWFSNLEIASDLEAAIGGELGGSVFNLQYVAESTAESVEELSEISDDGEVVSYCTFSRSDGNNCYAGEYAGVAERLLPAATAGSIREVGLSGLGNRLWGTEANFANSFRWTFIQDREAGRAFRAGAGLEAYDSPVLDEDGDTMLARSVYRSGGVSSRTGLSLVSYNAGLLFGPMPELRDFRYRVTENRVDLDVAVNENVASVRAQVFRDSWGNPGWFDEPTPYPSWLGGSGGLTLTRDEDGRFSGSFSITDPAEVDDVVRLTAFNAEGNRISFIDAALDASIFGSLFTAPGP